MTKARTCPGRAPGRPMTFGGLTPFILIASAALACSDSIAHGPSAASDAGVCNAAADAATTVQDAAAPVAGDAKAAILSAFSGHAIVGGMSPAHGSKAADDFILDLIRSPALTETVNDIAIECGNALYQEVLDRYVAGEPVGLAEVSQVWRNTTQPSCRFATFYEQLIPLVRRINQRVSPERRMRVLACDPPLDWTKVDSPDDLEPFTARAESIASVLESQVLSRNRKALALFGVAHLRHGGGAVGIYELKYPRSTFTIADHRGFGNGTPLSNDNDELEKKMSSWTVPSMVPIKGTWLADLDAAYFDGRAQPGATKGYPGVDGYLYLGRRDDLLRQPASSRAIVDEAFLTELRRRALALQAPPDSPMHPEVVFQRESESSVFFFGPTSP
ncbi:MAG TPA: hypothetical protein VM580_24705 [Labilithrix sp.]|nr:hypothetical protein [Labilithrix sp.]